MNEEIFAQIVAARDQQARENPAIYQLKVVLLALLGNVYICLVLGVLFVISGALIAAIATLKLIAIKLLLWIGPVVWLMVRSLSVTVDPPDGLELKAVDAPRLFALIDDLQVKLNAPRFHHVLINNEFNAGVVQAPRFGVLGWYRNYLVIGLPLMQVLTLEQLAAVLAHEFGHLARGHGRLSNWIYRQRLRWSRLLDAFEQDQKKAGLLVKPFLRWFAPYFSAYSFPLARANEYAADASCAQVVTPAIAAQTLTRVEVIGSYLSEKFWPQIYQRADNESKPSFSPYQQLEPRLLSELEENSIQAWLTHAMTRETSAADTHPSLRDRLGALGEAPVFVAPVINQSAAQLLGESFQRAASYCADCWETTVFEQWRQRYNKVESERVRLKVLDEKLSNGEELTLEEAFEHAICTENLLNDDHSVLVQFKAIYERAPEEAAINLHLGARLLLINDESGITFVERAMALDDDFTCRVFEVLRDYHWRNGQKEIAHSLNEKLVLRAELDAAADAERQTIQLNDYFLPNDIGTQELQDLMDQLKEIKGIKRAWLVKKHLRCLTNKPLYVLAFTVNRGCRITPRYTNDEIMYALTNKLSFAPHTFFINLGINLRFGPKIKKVKNSRIV